MHHTDPVTKFGKGNFQKNGMLTPTDGNSARQASCIYESGAIMQPILHCPSIKNILAIAKGFSCKDAETAGVSPLLSIEHIEKALKSCRLSSDILTDFHEIVTVDNGHDIDPSDIIPFSDEIACTYQVECMIEEADALASGFELGENDDDEKIALSAFAAAFLTIKFPGKKYDITSKLYEKYRPKPVFLRQFVNKIGSTLREIIIGQDHAIRTVEKALFRLMIMHHSQNQETGPAAFFLFAGPPGTGKTLLAKSLASQLQRPFKRFDLNCFSTPSEHEALIGSPKIFAKAAEGELTGFVRQHPDAILLFDEVEKAHSNTIKIFLQIIDEGYLRDHYRDEDISFSSAIIIFTTNAGKVLYDDMNYAPYLKIFPDIQRTVLLDALSKETDPYGRYIFPPALCSRFSKGNCVLFNRLGPAELVDIAGKEVQRVVKRCRNRITKEILVDDEVIKCLMLQEGGNIDARVISPKIERFIMDTIFSLAGSTEPERWDKIGQIRFCLDYEHEFGKIITIFRENDPNYEFRICVALPDTGIASFEKMKGIHRIGSKKIKWILALNRDELYEHIRGEGVDLVILDLQIDMVQNHFNTILAPTGKRWGSPIYWKGIEALEKISLHRPDLPVILYFPDLDTHNNERVWVEETIQHCVETGGVRDIIIGDLSDDNADQSVNNFKKIVKKQLETISLEKIYRVFKRSKKVLKFELSPKIVDDTLLIRLCSFSEITAWEASVLDSAVHRCVIPDVTFNKIFCQRNLIDLLKLISQQLKNWSSDMSEIRLPRGILLAGPPGNGKTMIAKAFARESSTPFFTVSASGLMAQDPNQASTIRELFVKAREYAPSVIFMDEIDAIGYSRDAVDLPSLVLNELLVQIDGFSVTPSPPVILLGATNQVERLDPALMRRFDLVLPVTAPDVEKIKEFLDCFIQKHQKSLSLRNADFKKIIEQMKGLSYADIENILNLALIFSSEHSPQKISIDFLEKAIKIYQLRNKLN